MQVSGRRCGSGRDLAWLLAFSALLTPLPARSALLTRTPAKCLPSLQLGDLYGGGRNVSLSAGPSGCSCRLLKLRICSSNGKPLPRTDQRCNATNTDYSENFAWVDIGRGNRSLRYWPPGENKPDVNVTAFFAGWYRASCCRAEYDCPDNGKPNWIAGLNTTTWSVNANVSADWLSEAPHLTVKFIQKAPQNFFLPWLSLDIDGPLGYIWVEKIKIDENVWLTKKFNISEEAGKLKLGQYPEYIITFKAQDYTVFNCQGNSNSCPRSMTKTTPYGDVVYIPARQLDWIYVLAVIIAVALASLVVCCYAGLRSRVVYK